MRWFAFSVKTNPGRACSSPRGERLLRRVAAERVVDLHRGQLGRVVGEALPHLEALRVEDAVRPLVVGEPRGAEVERAAFHVAIGRASWHAMADPRGAIHGPRAGPRRGVGRLRSPGRRRRHAGGGPRRGRRHGSSLHGRVSPARSTTRAWRRCGSTSRTWRRERSRPIGAPVAIEAWRAVVRGGGRPASPPGEAVWAGGKSFGGTDGLDGGGRGDGRGRPDLPGVPAASARQAGARARRASLRHPRPDVVPARAPRDPFATRPVLEPVLAKLGDRERRCTPSREAAIRSRCRGGPRDPRAVAAAARARGGGVHPRALARGS